MFSVEITRRCNLRCNHCLRGDAQDIDLSPVVIEAIGREFESIEDIDECEGDSMGDVNLTGGEPFLNPAGIIALLNVLPERYRASMITNGAAPITPAVIEAYSRLIERAEERGEIEDGIFPVMYSNDDWHDEAMTIWKRLAEPKNNEAYPMTEEQLLGMGRARDVLGVYNDRTNNGGMLTITVSGDIVEGCNYEFGYEEVLGSILNAGDLRRIILERNEASEAKRKAA